MMLAWQHLRYLSQLAAHVGSNFTVSLAFWHHSPWDLCSKTASQHEHFHGVLIQPKTGTPDGADSKVKINNGTLDGVYSNVKTSNGTPDGAYSKVKVKNRALDGVY